MLGRPHSETQRLLLECKRYPGIKNLFGKCNRCNFVPRCALLAANEHLLISSWVIPDSSCNMAAPRDALAAHGPPASMLIGCQVDHLSKCTQPNDIATKHVQHKTAAANTKTQIFKTSFWLTPARSPCKLLEPIGCSIKPTDCVPKLDPCP